MDSNGRGGRGEDSLPVEELGEAEVEPWVLPAQASIPASSEIPYSFCYVACYVANHPVYTKGMQVLQKATYLTMIQNAVNSKLFQTVWVQDEENIRDVLDGGDLSCAFFVSSMLHHFGLIGAPHATVKSTVVDLEKSGWQKTDDLAEGVVIVWEQKAQAHDEPHKHIGFYVGNDMAISNSYQERVPVRHNVTFDGTRKIEALYTHDFLS